MKNISAVFLTLSVAALITSHAEAQQKTPPPAPKPAKKFLCDVACGSTAIITAAKSALSLKDFKDCKAPQTFTLEQTKIKVGKKTLSTYHVTLADFTTILDETSNNKETGEEQEIHFLREGVSIECKNTDPEKPDFTQKALLIAANPTAPSKEPAEAADASKKKDGTSGVFECPKGTVWAPYYNACYSTQSNPQDGRTCHGFWNGYTYMYQCFYPLDTQAPK